MIDHISIGVRDIALPITPEAVWRAMREAKGRSSTVMLRESGAASNRVPRR